MNKFKNTVRAFIEWVDLEYTRGAVTFNMDKRR